MRQLALVAAIAAQLSCANHPALTVGVGAGSIGLLSCEVQGASQGTCGIITGIAAVGLGGLAWLVTHFADTSAHQLPDDDETLTDGTVRLHTHTALPPVPPVPLDGGLVDATVQPAQGLVEQGSGSQAGQSSGGSAAPPSS
ncbi:hypothetical protein BH11MYX1_BH11MYX1_40030 [soil metagenome]